MPGLIEDMFRRVGLPALKRAAGLAARLVPVPQPTSMLGPGSSVRLMHAISLCGHRKLFVVTDRTLVETGLLQPLLDALRDSAMPCLVFDAATADAPIHSIEQGLARFRAEACDAVLAFGGGSVIDCAKVIALAATNRHRSTRRLVGYFRARHAPAPLYAVPTTAGTGSEATAVAVVSDPQAQRKLLIVDTRIVPRLAALDPRLMTGLPRDITAATGMDALTHAIEAAIGNWSSEFSDRMARSAVALIWHNLPLACDNGADLAAREQMALAAHHAGLAFTRASVGNVHAIAHQLGARYHTPHGLANAILLPHVLRFECSAAVDRLAVLARCAGLGEPGASASTLARQFIDAIDVLNRRLGIPPRLDALREPDIPALARAACREADFNYPVPRVMSASDCDALLRQVLA
jgi:alcohol dehydrogenase